ncbi:hypothetical protein [Microbacterium azadirachtae]|uniref:Uncharacterized protein n=1 Tax=Microbacterium azadirachtae TaxID=582680 RepID=A0A0F0LML8_9MICO|nr:hypothetical protein [Microbacterium azadirachtae]KJL34388.1 hypothetical protein RS86_00874 [Microbacterium azadirachtae]
MPPGAWPVNPSRRDVALPDGCTELEWVLHEPQPMLPAVNDLRAAAGKNPEAPVHIR